MTKGSWFPSLSLCLFESCLKTKLHNVLRTVLGPLLARATLNVGQSRSEHLTLAKHLMITSDLLNVIRMGQGCMGGMVTIIINAIRGSREVDS